MNAKVIKHFFQSVSFKVNSQTMKACFLFHLHSISGCG